MINITQNPITWTAELYTEDGERTFGHLDGGGENNSFYISFNSSDSEAFIANKTTAIEDIATFINEVLNNLTNE